MTPTSAYPSSQAHHKQVFWIFSDKLLRNATRNVIGSEEAEGFRSSGDDGNDLVWLYESEAIIPVSPVSSLTELSRLETAEAIGFPSRRRWFDPSGTIFKNNAQVRQLAEWLG